MIEKGDNIITVKKIRIKKNIESTDRSKINFIWRSLGLLANVELLDVTETTGPNKYIIKYSEKIDVDKLLTRIRLKT